MTNITIEDLTDSFGMFDFLEENQRVNWAEQLSDQINEYRFSMHLPILERDSLTACILDVAAYPDRQAGFFRDVLDYSFE